MQKRRVSFIIVIILLPLLVVFSATTGSIDITPIELIKGLISGTDDQVLIIKDLRFPRIIIALFAGATLSISGVLLQAIMRNPLAEPGIIGVSSGAGFFTIILLTYFPTMFFYTPLFAFIGGLISFILVFTFSWKSGLHPLRMVLIGVAMNAIFTGFSEIFSFSGNSLISSVTVNRSTLAMKTWNDVQILTIYGTIGLVLAMFFYTYCNHLTLKDQTLKSLGFRVNRARIILATIAVMLASVTTAIAGMFTFVGLIIPHIGRSLVGTDHKYLIPFSALAGAILILAADTIGRTVISPIEIPASTIMVVIGGPFLILLLRKSDRIYGN